MNTGQTRSKRKASAKRGNVDGRKLLVSFRDKDRLLGVSCATMRKLAVELNLKETQVVHIALPRLADSILPAYEPDDGSLTAVQRRRSVNWRAARSKARRR